MLAASGGIGWRSGGVEDAGEFAPGIRLLALGYLFRRPLHDDLAAAVAALGAKIDDPVGAFDHVEIVFDDEQRRAVVEQPVEGREQLLDVLEVESGGRFIEKIERAVGLRLNDVTSQFNALRLAAR